MKKNLKIICKIFNFTKFYASPEKKLFFEFKPFYPKTVSLKLSIFHINIISIIME